MENKHGTTTPPARAWGKGREGRGKPCTSAATAPPVHAQPASVLPDGVARGAHAVYVLVEHLGWPRTHYQADERIPQRQQSSAAHPTRHCATRPAHEPARRERGSLVSRSGAARFKTARGGAEH